MAMNILKTGWKPTLILAATGLTSFNTYYLLNLKVDQDQLKNEQLLQKKMIPPPVVEKESIFEKKIYDQMNMLSRRLAELDNRIKNVQEDREEKRNNSSPQISASSADSAELTMFLKSQIDAYQSNLNENLQKQRDNLDREHAMDLEDRIRRVENKYKPIVNKIDEIESSVERQSKVSKDIFEKELPARLLWLACQDLMHQLKHNNNFTDKNFSIPLEQAPSYATIKDLADKRNPLARTVFNSIPKRALSEGVCSEDTLLNRFKKVDTICRRVAMIGDGGGDLVQHLVSYLQSVFLLESDIKISQEELSGQQLVDPSRWDTFAILARVRYCLATNNLEQALRYANQLRGQARIVAKDWMNDARTHLETKQALSILATQAEATALDMLYQSSSKVRGQVI